MNCASEKKMEIGTRMTTLQSLKINVDKMSLF